MPRSKKKVKTKKSNLSLIISFLTIAGLAGSILWLKKESWQPAKTYPWDQVNEIEIQSSEEKKVILRKQDNRWILASQNDLPAGQEKLDSFLQALKAFEQKDLLSTNPDKYATFGLDTDYPFLIVKFAGETPAISFVVGKTSYTRGGTLIKLKEENKVFLIPSYLNSQLSQENWQELNITKNVSPTAEKISLTYQDQEFNWEKQNDKWSNEQVPVFLESLDYLLADSLFKKEEKEDQIKDTNPELSLTIKSQDQTELNLAFYVLEKEVLVGKKQFPDLIWQLPQADYETIVDNLNSLITSQ